MQDDDIPIITNVVRRDRRADLTLTAEQRQSITSEVTAMTNTMLDELLNDTAEQVRALLYEQLQLRLADSLPAIIESVIQNHLDQRNGQ
ncbi:MAG: hypothetical protein AAGJ86_08025 [Pseudomonadota bacterium]